MKKFFAFIFGFFLVFGIVGRSYSSNLIGSPIGFVFKGEYSTLNNTYLPPTAVVNPSLGNFKITGAWQTSIQCGPAPQSMLDTPFIYGTVNVITSASHTCGSGYPQVRNYAAVVSTTDPVTPSTPAHCSDGILNEGEEGIDCGGTCPLNVCVPLCPPGTAMLSNEDGGCPGLPLKTGCWARTPKDRYGNCPVGYIPIYDACNRDPRMPFDCIAIVDPVLAADPNQELDPLEDPWAGTGVVSSESSETTSVPNAIGGTDQTTTKTTTDSEGNSKTETTTVSTDAAGKEVSRETEITESAPNTDVAVPGLTADDFDNSIPSEFNQSVTFGLDDRLVNHSALSSIGSTRLVVDSQSSVVDFSYNGNEIYFDLNRDYIVSALSTIGNLLFFISLIGSFFIMFGGND